MVFKLRFLSNQKDWEGLLAWLNDYRKKHSRSLFRQVKAAIKKAIKGGGKQRFTFQYDPSSYALNFDDDSGNLEGQINAFQRTHVGDSLTNRNYIWVYVVKVKAYNIKGGSTALALQSFVLQQPWRFKVLFCC